MNFAVFIPFSKHRWFTPTRTAVSNGGTTPDVLVPQPRGAGDAQPAAGTDEIKSPIKQAGASGDK